MTGADQLLSYAIYSFGLGIALFLIRRWIVDLTGKVETVIENHHKCQRSLPKEYAEKRHTEDTFGKVWAKIDIHSSEIARLMGKLNGGG